MRVQKTSAVLWMLLGTLLAQQRVPRNVQGLVTSQDGNSVSEAFVLVRDYQQFTPDYVSHQWETRTGADGRFAFKIEAGCYDFFISAGAQFLPFSQRMCIEANSRVLTFALKSDPHPRGVIRKD